MLGVSPKVPFLIVMLMMLAFFSSIVLRKHTLHILSNRLNFQGNCLQSNDPKQRPSTQCGGASPAKSQPVVDHQFHQLGNHVRKHHGLSEPTWLLALEIVAGTMVGSLCLIAILAAFQRCNNKSSIIIPWKKSASQKYHTAVYIGSVSLSSTFVLCQVVRDLF